MSRDKRSSATENSLASISTAETELRAVPREHASRAAFLDAWSDLEPAVADYRDGLGCC